MAASNKAKVRASLSPKVSQVGNEVIKAIRVLDQQEPRLSLDG